MPSPVIPNYLSASVSPSRGTQTDSFKTFTDRVGSTVDK